MLKIKDIKIGQMFYAMDDNGEPYGFKASGNAELVNGVLRIEAEDRGNYSYLFYEEDEEILYATDSLED